jgi:hypothetical protein
MYKQIVYIFALSGFKTIRHEAIVLFSIISDDVRKHDLVSWATLSIFPGIGLLVNISCREIWFSLDIRRISVTLRFSHY